MPGGSKPSSEHLRLIDLLKAQLKKAEQEIQNLHRQQGQRSVMQGGGDVHDKNVKIATLQHRFENLDSAFGSQKQQLDNTKQVMDDIRRELFQEKSRNAQLEVQLRAAEMGAGTAKDFQMQITELEREKKMMEAKYKDLVESPFFKDIGDKAANPARLKV